MDMKGIREEITLPGNDTGIIQNVTQQAIVDVGKPIGVTEHHHDIETESFLIDMRGDFFGSFLTVFIDIRDHLPSFQVKHPLMSSYGGRCSQ